MRKRSRRSTPRKEIERFGKLPEEVLNILTGYKPDRSIKIPPNRSYSVNDVSLALHRLPFSGKFEQLNQYYDAKQIDVTRTVEKLMDENFFAELEVASEVKFDEGDREMLKTYVFIVWSRRDDYIKGKMPKHLRLQLCSDMILDLASEVFNWAGGRISGSRFGNKDDDGSHFNGPFMRFVAKIYEVLPEELRPSSCEAFQRRAKSRLGRMNQRLATSY